VEARWGKSDSWFGAVVSKVNGDGTFTVDWEDGNTHGRTKRAEDLRGKGAAVGPSMVSKKDGETPLAVMALPPRGGTSALAAASASSPQSSVGSSPKAITGGITHGPVVNASINAVARPLATLRSELMAEVPVVPATTAPRPAGRDAMEEGLCSRATPPHATQMPTRAGKEAGLAGDGLGVDRALFPAMPAEAVVAVARDREPEQVPAFARRQEPEPVPVVARAREPEQAPAVAQGQEQEQLDVAMPAPVEAVRTPVVPAETTHRRTMSAETLPTAERSEDDEDPAMDAPEPAADDAAEAASPERPKARDDVKCFMVERADGSTCVVVERGSDGKRWRFEKSSVDFELNCNAEALSAWLDGITNQQMPGLLTLLAAEVTERGAQLKTAEKQRDALRGTEDYDFFGLDGNECSDKDVERAYRKKSAQLHPDKGGDEKAFDDMRKKYEQIKELRGEGKRKEGSGGGAIKWDPNSRDSMLQAHSDLREQIIWITKHFAAVSEQVQDLERRQQARCTLTWAPHTEK